MDPLLIEKAADIIINSNHAIALTGAGISTESGVPDFRSPGGIWERYDPTIFFFDRFISHPEIVWRSFIEMFTAGDLTLWDAKPNHGHEALSILEQAGLLKTVITQNIDNLHQKAGSRNVIDFHGNLLFAKCMCCSNKFWYEEVIEQVKHVVPPVCTCGGLLKPDIVLFGEPIPADAMRKSIDEADVCDLMLVVGTSAQVEPAASLPLIAKGMQSASRRLSGFYASIKDCMIIEINREPTPLTGRVSDFIIQGSTGAVLQSIVERIRKAKRIK
jgi:NAD-dependent deacetylase